MSVTKHEIEQARTPSSLRDFVESVREQAARNPAERHEANRRRGGYKTVLDEIFPLAKAASALYCDAYTVQPVVGNQGYDATVRKLDGSFVERLEVANPIDGGTVAGEARRLEERGFGTTRVGDAGDDIEALIPLIAETARKKAMKDYSDATVIFNVAAPAPPAGAERRYADQVARIKRTLRDAGLRAKRVVVLLPDGEVCRVA